MKQISRNFYNKLSELKRRIKKVEGVYKILEEMRNIRCCIGKDQKYERES